MEVTADVKNFETTEETRGIDMVAERIVMGLIYAISLPVKEHNGKQFLKDGK